MWEGDGRARCERGNWPLIAPSPMPYCRAPGAARDDPRRHGHRARAVRRGRRRAPRGRLRPARAAHGARLPALVLPLAADQRAQRRVRRLARRAGRGSRSRCSTRAARCGPRICRCRCGSPPPTGSRRVRRRRRGRAGADAARARLRHRGRLERSGLAAGAARRSGAATRRRSPTASATRPASRRSRSARSRATTTSTRSSLAGRADLCALARPHIYDPAWTLHAAAEQEFAGRRWVPQYQAGRASRRPGATRAGGAGADV